MRRMWMCLVVLVVSLSFSVAEASTWGRPNNGRRPNLSTVVAWSTQQTITIQHADGTRETVASEPNAALMPTFSKDGTRLAYATTRQDEITDWYMAVVVIDRKTGESIEYTGDFADWITSPELDPSGRFLAFLHHWKVEVWDISKLSEPEFVTILGDDPTLGISSFTWWERGLGLFFTQEVEVEGRHGIYSQGIYDNYSEVVTDDPDFDYESVTVTGNRLAFNRAYIMGGDWQLCARDLNVTEPHDIELIVWRGDWVNADGLNPVWDPLSKGNRLLYHNYSEGYLRVYALDLPSGVETVLSPVGATAFYPATYVERITPVTSRRVFGRSR